MATCPHSGSEHQALVAKVGHMATYRCNHCRQEWSCTESALSPDEMEAIRRSEEEVVLSVVWNPDRSMNEQVITLRNLIDSYQDIPIHRLKIMFANLRPKWKIGVYRRGEAEFLRARGALNGLLFDIEPQSGDG